MDKHSLSERDICTKFITPAIMQAGWQQDQFREEVKLTAGRVMVRGKLAVCMAPALTGTPIEQEKRTHLSEAEAIT